MTEQITEKKDDILIVDDEPQIRAILRRILARDFSCHIAGSAEEAEQVLRELPVKAVICDHYMPGENGLDLLARLQERNPKIKGILLTGNPEDDLFMQAINETHIFRFLVKPAEPDEILKAVTDAVRVYHLEDLQDQVILNAAQIDKEVHSVPYWIYRLRSLADDMARNSATIVGQGVFYTMIIGVVVLLIGIAIFLTLYFLKSFLGFDLFSDSHLGDFIK